MKCVLYLRVSTTGQESDNQRPALEKYAADNGYQVVAVYSENESAWSSSQHHELARLRADARQHKSDPRVIIRDNNAGNSSMFLWITMPTGANRNKA